MLVGVVLTGAAREEAMPISRWEQLRNEKKAPPSQWDEIRQSAARASLPGDARPTSNARVKDRDALEGELPQSTSSMTDSQGQRSDRRSDETAAAAGRDRESERSEFEKMMERERKGGDSDRDETKWRGR